MELKRILAVLLGIVCLALARLWANAALPGFPPHSYTWEWFLRTSPGETAFFLRYVVGCVPALVLLMWGIAPWTDRAVARLRNDPLAFKRLTAIGCAGAAALVAAAAWGLLRGQVVTDDEYVYVFQSRILLQGHAAMPAPPMPEFLRNIFVTTHEGRWLGQYPPGHPLVLMPGVLLGVPRLVPIVLAAANVMLVAAILRRLVGPKWALAGVFLLVTSPLFLLTGSTLLAHSTTFLGLALATFGALKVLERDSVRWGAAAGLGVGLAFVARPWTGATLGIFPLIVLGWAAMARGRRRAIAPALAALLACGAFFLWYNNQVTGSPLTTGYEVVRGPRMKEFGFGTTIPGVHEHTLVQGIKNAGILALRFGFWSWGWPLALLPCLAALLVRPMIRPKDASDGQTSAALDERALLAGGCVMLAAGFVSYVPYWATGVNDTGPVKTYELLLPFTVVTVIGARRWARRWGRGHVSAFFAASCICAIAVFWPPQIVHLRHVSGRVAEPLGAVETEAERPALVFVTTFQKPALGSWVYGPPDPKPDLSDPILYVRDLGSRNGEYCRLHPARHAYRLVCQGSGFHLAPLAAEEQTR